MVTGDVRLSFMFPHWSSNLWTFSVAVGEFFVFFFFMDVVTPLKPRSGSGAPERTDTDTQACVWVSWMWNAEGEQMNILCRKTWCFQFLVFASQPRR